MGIKCLRCQKTIASFRGSRTGWLLREPECHCEVNLPALPQIATQREIQAVEVDDELVGQIVDGRYRVIELLGTGGMGTVYKVVEQNTNATYALKILAKNLVGQKHFVKRLENEAAAVKALSHANIVPIFEFGGFHCSRPYLTMGFVDGQDLSSLIDFSNGLSTFEALDVFIQIAEALNHAHEKGVIHRDLKPSNILISKTPGNHNIVKLVDFGIAKVIGENENVSQLTVTGEIIGTPLYMSPEQCQGVHLDARSDIYSFGCVMFEVLTGRPPFAGLNAVEIILGHLSREVVWPDSIEIKPALKRIVSRCLEKLPADRYQSADKLRIDLEKIKDNKRIGSFFIRFNTKTSRRFIKLTAAFSFALSLIWYNTGDFLKATISNQIHSSARPTEYKGKSLVQWTEAIEHQPNNAELYLERATLHTKRDERSNAIADYTTAITLAPDDLRGYLNRAIAYTMTGEYKLAMADANIAIKKQPLSPGCYFARANVFRATEQFDQASKDLRQALSHGSGKHRYVDLAADLMALSEFSQAQAALHEVEKDGKSNAYARGLQLLLNTFQGNLTQATQVAHDMIWHSSHLAPFHWGYIAYFYAASRNMTVAEELIQRMKSLETFPARGYRLAGDIYRTAGFSNKAIQELSSATSLEEYGPSYRERALAFLALNQYRAARADLQKALKLNPQSTITKSYLALVESELGNQVKANELIKECFLGEDVQPTMVYINKSRVELNGGELDEALSDANEAIKRDPYIREAFEARAKIYDKQMNYKVAESDRTQAARLFPRLDNF